MTPRLWSSNSVPPLLAMRLRTPVPLLLVPRFVSRPSTSVSSPSRLLEALSLAQVVTWPLLAVKARLSLLLPPYVLPVTAATPGVAGTPRTPFPGPGFQYLPRGGGSLMGFPLVTADELLDGGVFASAERMRRLIDAAAPRSVRTR